MLKPTSPKGRPALNVLSFAVELNHKPKKDGNHALFLRITEGRKIQRVYLGFDIPLKDWNPNKREVRRSNVLFAQINGRIEELKGEANRLKAELRGATSAAIIENLRGRTSEQLFTFAEAFILRQAYNTARNLRTEVNKFREFVGDDTFRFADLSLSVLENYHRWLRQTKGNSLNTANKGLIKLRTIVNQAIRQGLLPVQENPFLLLKLSEGKIQRIRLTTEELQALEALDLPEGSLLWHVRNYWLFAFYGAGIRFSDVACMTWGNVTGGRLSYVMRKTAHLNGQQHTIQLPRQAEALLAHYRPAKPKPEDRIFPILNPKRVYTTEADVLKEISRRNALVNRYLKTLCLRAGIAKDLSFHSARHTFADLGRRKVGDVYAMSKLLRHSKIGITEKYLSDFDTETTDKALASIFG